MNFQINFLTDQQSNNVDDPSNFQVEGRGKKKKGHGHGHGHKHGHGHSSKKKMKYVKKIIEKYKNKGHKEVKVQRKYKKFMMPMLIAYKMKFFTLIPMMMAGLVLLLKTAGTAGFFFALFAAAMAMKKHD